MILAARSCRICGRPKGVFAFQRIDEIAAAAGITVTGTPGYAHPRCLQKAKKP